MAVKKTTKSSTKKAAAPKAKAAAPKKVATKAAPAAAKLKAAPKKAAAAAPKTKVAAPKKKAAPVKLTDKQSDLLKKVSDSKDAGYLGAKGESKVLESLQTKKLIKRGKKDKSSGNYSYTVSKSGAKHLSAPPAAPAN